MELFEQKKFPVVYNGVEHFIVISLEERYVFNSLKCCVFLEVEKKSIFRKNKKHYKKIYTREVYGDEKIKEKIMNLVEFSKDTLLKYYEQLEEERIENEKISKSVKEFEEWDGKINK